MRAERTPLSDAPSLLRLKKRSEFLAVAATGVKWVRPAFVIQFKHAPMQEATVDNLPLVAPRIGFTVTKKQGNAVRRNRIRRRLREAARLALPGVAAAGCDYVIIGRFAAAEMPFPQLKLELAEAVSRLHALKSRENQKRNPPA